jgi:broad specificity phosphatase PhoE
MKHVRMIRHAHSSANAGLPTTAPAIIPLTELGHAQAQALAGTLPCAPGLIVSSPFERAVATATPTARRYPDVPLELWAVEEFTYLAPARLVGTTQAQRKPEADAYWLAGDQLSIDGPGAESFAQLLQRAQAMLDRLASCSAQQVVVFSHGQFIRAVAWLILHGEQAGEPALMRQFRALDTAQPLANCASYQLSLQGGKWVTEYELSPEGAVRFIDEFCAQQPMPAVPAMALTREMRDALARRRLG